MNYRLFSLLLFLFSIFCFGCNKNNQNTNTVDQHILDSLYQEDMKHLSILIDTVTGVYLVSGSYWGSIGADTVIYDTLYILKETDSTIRVKGIYDTTHQSYNVNHNLFYKRNNPDSTTYWFNSTNPVDGGHDDLKFYKTDLDSIYVNFLRPAVSVEYNLRGRQIQ